MSTNRKVTRYMHSTSSSSTEKYTGGHQGGAVASWSPKASCLAAVSLSLYRSILVCEVSVYSPACACVVVGGRGRVSCQADEGAVSDGVEDQGAEDAFMGCYVCQERLGFVRFWKP